MKFGEVINTNASVFRQCTECYLISHKRWYPAVIHLARNPNLIRSSCAHLLRSLSRVFRLFQFRETDVQDFESQKSISLSKALCWDTLRPPSPHKTSELLTLKFRTSGLQPRNVWAPSDMSDRRQCCICNESRMIFFFTHRAPARARQGYPENQKRKGFTPAIFSTAGTFSTSIRKEKNHHLWQKSFWTNK